MTLRRAPLQRKTPLVSKTPLRAKTALTSRCVLTSAKRIAPVSPKRAALNKVYKRLRDEYMDAHPWCEYPEGCGAPSRELHHKRGRVGLDLIDVAHFAALCSDHHRYVTGHPEHAIASGASELRTGVRQ